MASDSDNDGDFVLYGTPLEPLEEDEPLKKPVPLHEQTVKDEKGRYQRFHGAFTGGFSAGYFNTVGSKEGWTPSTFVSSRQQKAEKQNARPEDFMDEEDFGEHGIAPRQITTSQEFSSSRRDQSREKAREINAQAALIPGDTLLAELITPAISSIGGELLRRMGWKEGQGVGPRVKRKAHRLKSDGGAKVYGCLLPPGGSEGSEEDDEEFGPDNVTFAPKDVTPVDFSPRVGLQGLGYCGLDPGLALLGREADEHLDLFRPESETRTRLFGGTQKCSRRAGVAGQAFGVGALEDDDEDVYHRDSMSKYDTVLGGEEPGDGLYGWTAPQQYTKKRDKSKDASYLGKILEGFTLAQKADEEKTIFPPPSLPRDYRPVHHFRPSVDVSTLSGVSPALAEALRTSRGHMVKKESQPVGRHQLDSGQRRTLLGEDGLQGPRSVMELLRPEDRERLLNFRNSNPPSTKPPTLESREAPRAAGSTAGTSSGVLPQSGAGLLGLQQQEALVAWRGVQTTSLSFRPFEKNPSKQARYELYLSCLQQGHKDALEQSLDPGMTEWERSREREEFVRASILYRPTSSSLSSRFTRAQHQEDDDTVEVSRDQEGDLDDKQAAVKMKMFGAMTRETFEWHPDKLLCKRFNVPDPYPGSGLVGLPKVKRDKFSVFNFLTVSESRDMMASPKPPESSKKSRWDVSERKGEEKQGDSQSELLSAAQTQTSETKLDQTSAPALPALPASICTSDQTPDGKTESKLMDQQSSAKKKGDEEEEDESRPSMDLFKAIFASSSDEKSSSSSEGDGEDDENENDMKEKETKVDSQPVNLFNISAAAAAATTTTTSTQLTAVTSSQTSTQEEFGPKLPPPSAASSRGGITSRCSLGENDKDQKRHKDKKHKNKKQHKHKKDKKKKHKKHRHRAKPPKSKEEASDCSSEDSDAEDGQMSTEELLNRLKRVRPHQSW